MSYILVTGGAGYIGSHTVVELVNNGYNVVVVDNLVNSSYDVIVRIEVLTRKQIPFFKIDLNDHDALDQVFKAYPIQAVLHFAALKAVGESTKFPLNYYSNNVGGAISLLKVMEENNVKNIVFSSSATVYGDATRFENMIPIPEHCPTGPTNPYGETKITIENIIRDVYANDKSWKCAILRYFNPIGAHPSGLIGEDPLGIPNNLLPFLAQVAIGRREKLSVFGSDYNSKDGTPIRDYIHVIDLAKGHIAALNYLFNHKDNGLCREWNLGTGNGSTVFEVFNAFCEAVGKKLPFEVVGRRDGDVLNLTANPKRANTELKWKAQLSINDACKDLWNWTTKNPFGFQINNYSWTKFDSESLTNYDRLNTVRTFNGKFEVSISNHGATIVAAKLNGIKLNLGFDNLKGYLREDNPFFGATIGRVANRISKGDLLINGTHYQVGLNEAHRTSLHGGTYGYNKRTFLGPIVKTNEKEKETTMEFVLIDLDGTEGYPGDVETKVIYTVRDTGVGGELGIEYEAKLLEESGRDSTAVSLTNHSYWNIGNQPSIEGTHIKLVSNKHLESNPADSTPTGKIVTSTDLDSQNSAKLGPDGPVFDYCFVTKQQDKLDTRNDELRVVATATHPKTRIAFTTLTTEPAFQFYTGDGVDVAGVFTKRSGFCLEASRYIYNPKWFIPLNKGEVYGSYTIYRFENF
ncbi:hypothetical protein PACTADRAFT_51895 [Pachysolen tannophilus NRRL Y-2460]|uniref:NAD(P)-binding domain-containing protein n=1 Tax=Pachysolen tannophilus NRRL Y-2460 TaxID=669874 RepID=A0A1E4TNE7_PACTA|nr:hypothetical protein PACTADRAFT_51895 [Pachysolen tannophilus NRRL Y-2460]